MKFVIRSPSHLAGAALTIGDVLDRPSLDERCVSERDVVSLIHCAMRFRFPHYYEIAMTSQRLATHIARNMAETASDAEAIGIAVGLSDTGELVMPEAAGNPMTHVELGSALLRNLRCPIFNLAADCALSHHECYDGSGFPAGVMGEDIPLVARIAAVSLHLGKSVNDTSVFKGKKRDMSTVGAVLEAMREEKFDPSVIAAARRVVRQLDV